MIDAQNLAVCSSTSAIYGGLLSHYMINVCVINTVKTYASADAYCTANGMGLLVISDLDVETAVLLWGAATFGLGTVLSYKTFYVKATTSTCAYISNMLGVFLTTSTTSCSTTRRSLCQYTDLSEFDEVFLDNFHYISSQFQVSPLPQQVCRQTLPTKGSMRWEILIYFNQQLSNSTYLYNQPQQRPQRQQVR